ncbi:MAG: hypothetical protein V1779_16615 [bacterium]
MKLRITQILSIILLLALALPAGAKDFSQEEIKKNLPKMLGANNVGREFYFSFIPCWETPNAKNDLKLYISSGVQTLVTVEVEGKGYSKQQKTVPNDIIEFTLVPSIGQAYRKVHTEPPEAEQVWRSAGVHVKADDPIICYGVTRYQYTSDGFLAIPVPALGKDYIVASFADVASNSGQWLPSYTSITAPYDKTKVFFTMGGSAWSRTVSGLTPGQTSTWSLNRGDVLLISSLGKDSELSGSIITASKPVAVVSGNFCAYIPTNCGCCDVIEEMELPTSSWGTEYHVTRIVNRLKNSLIKVFAKEAKTKIFMDHLQIGFLRNGGGQEQDGYLSRRADVGAPRPIVYSGDKPIGVTQYNCGQLDDNIVSDPFQLILTPLEQYQREIIFNTPGIKGGFGFPYNYINLCYEATPYGTIPQDLMFAQVIAGKYEWTPIKDMSPTPGDPFVKVQGGKIFYSKTLLLPGDGVYKIKADNPFTAYAYGFSWCDSYGFPTSVALGDLTKVDTIPPEPAWILDCNGTVNVINTGYVIEKPDDEANRTNMSTIYMHSDKSYNYKLFHGDFMPCEVQTVPWRLEIIDNREDALAVVTFADCAGNDSTVIIQYNAVKLTIVPKSIDYGLHSVGQTTDKMFYVVNQSETSEAYLKYLQLKRKDEVKPPKPQGFTIWDSTGTVPLPTVFGGDKDPGIRIGPLDSMPFIVRFEAKVEGEFWDSIGLGDTCNFWYKSYAYAMVGSPIIDVTDWLFPPTMLGSSAFGSFTIENKGTVMLKVYDFQGPFMTGNVSNTKIYESMELVDQNITPATPLQLKPKEKREFQVKFTPDEQKTYPDSIVFISNTIKDKQYNNGNEIDSVCVLLGTGIQSDLIATGYNWDRKRISRAAPFYIAPYPAVINAMNPDTAIRLYNGGTAAVTINRLTYKQVVGDTSAFKFKRSDLLRTLNPGEEVIIPVTFQPTKTGQHYLEFEYGTVPKIDNVVTTLQGVGIVPRTLTADVDFGTMIMGDYNNSILEDVTITNTSNTDWQYGDSVTITGLTESNIYDDISTGTDWSTFTEPFRYDKGELVFNQGFTTPVVLQPGESITFKGEFAARSGDPVSGSLTTVSDAEAEVVSNWTGDGQLQSAQVTGASTVICLGSKDENMNVLLENTNETDLTVDTVFITGPDASYFDFYNSADKGPFTLPANSPKTIQFVFTADRNNAGTRNATVEVRTSALNEDSLLTATLTGTEVHYDRALTVTPANNSTPYDINTIISRTINILPSAPMTGSKVESIYLKIRYNGDFLKLRYDPANQATDPDGDGVILGSIFDKNMFGYRIPKNIIQAYKDNVSIPNTNFDADEYRGELEIEIYKKQGFDNIFFDGSQGGELLTLTFGTYLPKLDSTEVTFSIISADAMQLNDEACITITGNQSKILLDRTCVFDIRKIIFSSGTFALNAIKPNPVSGDEAVIEFEIATKDCPTKIEIYNSLNQLMAVPVESVMQPGRYEVTVPVGNWASGSYNYIMKAGPFEGQQRMIIVR